MFRHKFSIRGVVAPVTVALLAMVVFLAAGTALAQSDRVYSDATGYWRYYNGQWYQYTSYVNGDNGYYAGEQVSIGSPEGVPPKNQ
jgi:hypothetical protein